MVLSSGSDEAAGDINRSVVDVAATMTETVLQHPSVDIKVPDIHVQDQDQAQLSHKV